VSRFQEEYNRKLVSADEVAQLVKSGNMILYGEFTMYPYAFDEALARRVNELKDVTVNVTTGLKIPEVVKVDLRREHFLLQDFQLSPFTRYLSEHNLCNYTPLTYSNAHETVAPMPIDLAVVGVTKMNEDGYFSLSVSNSVSPAWVPEMDRQFIKVLEVHPQAPFCMGGYYDCIHISQVDYVIEGSDTPLAQIPSVTPSEIDKKIADIVVNEIENGACLQLGIGGIPGAIGSLIAHSDLKEMGVHTEMMMDAFVDLYEAGKITGQHKSIDRYKMAYCFALGTQRLYDFLHENPGCASYPAAYTNDPAIIKQNDKVVSINNALQIDLLSQVSAESQGFRQISGTGGQLDFMLGSMMSKGGKGFICMNSTYTDKEGKAHSRIMPTLTEGTVVTTPRSLAHYVVTEYGIIQLKGLNTWQRAEALISIAHPDFRDELVAGAGRMGLWKRSQKQMD
jgi:butyryl-CoA:acetate CoA-transferase